MISAIEFTSVLRRRFTLKLAFAMAVAIIGADHGAANRLSASVTRTPAALTLAVAPATVIGGNPATATITLTAPAATDLEITLKSLNNDVAQFGAHFQAIGTSQLTIPKGNIQATFPVRTFGVLSSTAVKLQAISGPDTAETTITIKPAGVKTLVITPVQIIGGNVATGVVTLDGLAPATSGVFLQLSEAREAASRNNLTSASGSTAPSSPTGLTATNFTAPSIPASVNIPAGGSSATFSISTSPVPIDITVRITAQRPGVHQPSVTDGTSNTIIIGESATGSGTGSAAADLTIQAPKASALSLTPPSVPGGMGSIGTLVLTGPAPAGGLPVSVGTVQNLQNTWGGDNNTALVPSQITVPAGANTTSFKISTFATSVPKSVTIRAGALPNNVQVLPYLEDGSVRTVNSPNPNGFTNAQAILSISPTPLPLTISVQPPQVTGGSMVTFSIGIQPNSGTAIGAVSLSSNHPELLLVPTSVAMSGGNTLSLSPTSITVNANTLFATADQTVTVTATGGSASASTPLLIKQTPPLASFTLRGTTVTGGQNIIGQLLLVSNANAPVTVSLTTNNPQFVTVPATITIPNSPAPTPLNFRTSAPAASTNVSITASAGGQTITQTITLVP